MDLVRILSEAVAKLPSGDHSPGLSAVVRHIAAAVRHFNRGSDADQDSCTDAVYRTNQAYEGSLKEAYRVLTAKDPTGMRTYDIEQYLESEGVLRPRVLTQLARYRQDYRNPSTHDYWLDFGKAEALLAIVSVCAFATLLVDQINTKLTASIVRSRLKETRIPDKSDIESGLAFVANSIFKNMQVIVDNALEDTKGAALGVLESLGLVVSNADSEWSLWDISTKVGEADIGVELRFHDSKKGNDNWLSYMYSAINSVSGGILVEYSHQKNLAYSLFKTKMSGKSFYIVTPDECVSLPSIRKYLTDIELVSAERIVPKSRGSKNVLQSR